jgi:hypothetical protein
MSIQRTIGRSNAIVKNGITVYDEPGGTPLYALKALGVHDRMEVLIDDISGSFCHIVGSGWVMMKSVTITDVELLEVSR